MGTFITGVDYARSITETDLLRLTGGDDTLLDVAEADALSLMAGYLATRFDTGAIFAATGDSRHPIIVKYGVDIAIHALYSRLQPDEIPEHRVEAYNAAERWLSRLSKGTVDPPGLPRPENNSTDHIRWGGWPPRQLQV